MNVQLISRKLKTRVRSPLFYIVMSEARKYTKIHKSSCKICYRNIFQ